MRERRLPIYRLYSSVKKTLIDGILKIKSNIKKKLSIIYNLYFLVRSILISILLGVLVILFLNNSYNTFISEIDFSKILTIFKNLL